MQVIQMVKIQGRRHDLPKVRHILLLLVSILMLESWVAVFCQKLRCLTKRHHTEPICTAAIIHLLLWGRQWANFFSKFLAQFGCSRDVGNRTLQFIVLCTEK